MSTARVDVQQLSEPPATASRPRVVVRADLLPALRVLVVIAVLGLPLGWLWSRLAPPEIASVVADPDTGQLGVVPLLGQSEHRFDGMAVFVLIGLGAGLLIGQALWLRRSLRGPVVVVGAVLGSLVGAWLAMHLGLWLVQWHYPPADLRPGEAIARAPVLASAWVIVTQPFGVAIAYSLAVSWNSSADLGRGPL